MQDPLLDFKKSIKELKANLESAISKNIASKKKTQGKIFDFSQNKTNYLKNSLLNSVKQFNNSAWSLCRIHNLNKSNEKTIIEILELSTEAEQKYNMLNFEDSLSCIERVEEKILVLKSGMQNQENIEFNVPSLPSSIESEVKADVRELKRCFDAGCYRSATILCGRILETALHRKYYEVTGNDILETSPGIGLGNLIGKLNDKIDFDPALKDQIHLINKVRISSVHKKKDVFFPTRQQAYAITLYTLDILKKLFNKI
ncbi:MAG: DUF4145 domain-containing protein [Candidatus Nanoarchaeia archaeon]|nr:DUF4145 domain-containing protein [Candidatus Nanoarchaeia archaeon]